MVRSAGCGSERDRSRDGILVRIGNFWAHEMRGLSLHVTLSMATISTPYMMEGLLSSQSHFISVDRICFMVIFAERQQRAPSMPVSRGRLVSYHHIRNPLNPNRRSMSSNDDSRKGICILSLGMTFCFRAEEFSDIDIFHF
jgi:hypothetical protein